MLFLFIHIFGFIGFCLLFLFGALGSSSISLSNIFFGMLGAIICLRELLVKLRQAWFRPKLDDTSVADLRRSSED